MFNEITPQNGSYVLIGIDGPGGSGKSTFARQLQQEIPKLEVIHGDDYFEPLPDSEMNDVPGRLNPERFMQDTGHDMSLGKRELRMAPFNWTLGRTVMASITVDAGIIREGVKTFELPINWDVSIWIDAPRDIRRLRCIYQRSNADRQAKETDPGKLTSRFNAWADEADDYRRRVQPEKTADCILTGTDPFDVQLETLSSVLASKHL